jgi:NAD(P)-dependent dehydrogenase (short-subunit alcohol dehydrogenase family)
MQSQKLNIVIIGAGGALGGEFAKQLSKNDNVNSIFAFSSSNTKFNNDKIISDFIDIEQEESIKLAAIKASNNSNIDMVIVATGMLHDKEIYPEKSLNDLLPEKFQKLFNINTIAPAMVAKYFIPKLNKSSKSIFVALSARVGSISDNYLGGWYAYRASKAALNMILKNIAIETARSNKNAIIVGLHPGTVASKLSKPFQKSVSKDKLFTAEYSVQKMLNVIDNLTISDSGNIIDFNAIKIDY